MTIQEWKEKCINTGYTAEGISELSGIPIETVREIIWGTRIPNFKLWECIDSAINKPRDMVREPAIPYYVNREKTYTVRDYLKIPNEIRVELIDGQIYEMATPTFLHQVIIVKIITCLENFIKDKKGKCIPILAPLDVKLSEDNKTVVQPDIMVICNRDVVKRRFLEYAPELVIEVLSPSTRKKDAGIKMQKYKETGVKEYWMVDPEKRVVIVYEFDKSDIPKMYNFDSKVPVGIFEEQCEINFAEIYQELAFMFE